MTVDSHDEAVRPVRFGTRGGVLGATATAVVAGLAVAVVGLGISIVLGRAAQEGMRGLGILVGGMLLSAVAGLLVAVLVAVWAYRRAVPAGRRALAVIAFVVDLVLAVSLGILVHPVASLLVLPGLFLGPLAVTGHLGGLGRSGT